MKLKVLLFSYHVFSGKYSEWYEADDIYGEFYCPNGAYIFAFIINVLDWIIIGMIGCSYYYGSFRFRYFDEYHEISGYQEIGGDLSSWKELLK